MSYWQKFNLIFKACRPPTLLSGLGPVLIGNVMGMKEVPHALVHNEIMGLLKKVFLQIIVQIDLSRVPQKMLGNIKDIFIRDHSWMFHFHSLVG